jgi:hypothetical protein
VLGDQSGLNPAYWVGVGKHRLGIVLRLVARSTWFSNDDEHALRRCRPVYRSLTAGLAISHEPFGVADLVLPIGRSAARAESGRFRIVPDRRKVLASAG